MSDGTSLGHFLLKQHSKQGLTHNVIIAVKLPSLVEAQIV